MRSKRGYISSLRSSFDPHTEREREREERRERERETERERHRRERQREREREIHAYICALVNMIEVSFMSRSVFINLRLFS